MDAGSVGGGTECNGDSEGLGLSPNFPLPTRGPNPPQGVEVSKLRALVATIPSSSGEHAWFFSFLVQEVQVAVEFETVVLGVVVVVSGIQVVVVGGTGIRDRGTVGPKKRSHFRTSSSPLSRQTACEGSWRWKNGRRGQAGPFPHEKSSVSCHFRGWTTPATRLPCIVLPQGGRRP